MASAPYHLSLARPDKVIVTGQLRLGGADSSGNTIAVNNYYVTRNGKPFFILSGEFHYARYPEAGWETELRKMKAAGINTVASYVFWSYHETQPGVFDWSGSKNLRRFVELCARQDLNFVLRPGPFVHGEWRNGGLPDWLYGQPYRVRSNDPRYLAQAERWYTEVGKQAAGLYFKDGGPILAVQIENEYMHAGAPWEVVDAERPLEWIPAGSEGTAHLKALKDLAQRAGLDTPLYIVTAWGAPILEGESLPVYGGYAYPVWIDDPAPSALYLFQDGHARPDEHPLHHVPNIYPLANAEMQGGIQNRYHNRPIVPAASVEAFALVRLGSGSNWLGYYMFHGGTTPRSERRYNHERYHPQLSYDFQAPIGEYGQVRDSYRALKLIHLFVNAYSEVLMPLGTLLPECAATLVPEDVETPRFCVRAARGAGFLFVNNFQDHVAMRDLHDVVFALDTPQGTLTLPETGALTVQKDVCFILPFNQTLETAHLVYATAQPLTILRTETRTQYFFFAVEGIEPEYCFRTETLKDIDGGMVAQTADSEHRHIRPMVGAEHSFGFTAADGRRVEIITLTRREAEYTWQGEVRGQAHVVVCPADVLFDAEQIEVSSTAAAVALTIFPPLTAPILRDGTPLAVQSNERSSQVELALPQKQYAVELKDCGDFKYVLQFPADFRADAPEAFLEINYAGDTGMAFLDGQLIADNFCNGLPWVIGLERFMPELFQRELCLVFRPTRAGVTTNVSSQVAARFQFEGAEQLVIHSVTLKPHYTAHLRTA